MADGNEVITRLLCGCMFQHVIRHIVATSGEVAWYRSHVFVVSNFENQRHPYFNMELNMAMEQPVPRVVSFKSNHCVATVRYCNSVFNGSIFKVPRQKTGFIEGLNVIYCCLARQPPHPYNSKAMSVEMEWMVSIKRNSFI